MATRITETLMISDATPAGAARIANRWAVTWLPDRLLDRNQAITAMTIVECVTAGVEPGDRWWPHLMTWLAELGLTVVDLHGRCPICLTPVNSPLDPWSMRPGGRRMHLLNGEIGCPGMSLVGVQ